MDRKTVHLDETDFMCPICLSLLFEPILLRCSHRFCKKCILGIRPNAIGSNPLCPVCRHEFNRDTDVNIDLFLLDFLKTHFQEEYLEREGEMKEVRQAQKDTDQKKWHKQNWLIKKKLEEMELQKGIDKKEKQRLKETIDAASSKRVCLRHEINFLLSKVRDLRTSPKKTRSRSLSTPHGEVRRAIFRQSGERSSSSRLPVPWHAHDPKGIERWKKTYSDQPLIYNRIHSHIQGQRHGCRESFTEMDGLDRELNAFEDDVDDIEDGNDMYDDEYDDDKREEEEIEEEELESELESEVESEVDDGCPIEWSGSLDSEPKSDDEFFMRRVVGELDDEITKFQTLRAKLSDSRQRPKSRTVFSSHGGRTKDGINRTKSTSQLVGGGRGWSAHGSKRRDSVVKTSRERSGSDSKVDEWQELRDLIEKF
jgi:hypothetical protein